MNLSNFMKSLKHTFEFNRNLRELAASPKPKVEVIEDFSSTDLEKQRESNRNTILELLENITKTNVVTRSVLRESNLLYKYACDNPLKKFVPINKKFEGKTFREYENEFNLYYKMFKN